MRAVYRNPKELGTKMKDLIDTYRDNLITYDKLEETVLAMIKANEDRIYKNGFMPVKLANVLGEDRKEIIDEIAKKL